MKSLITLSILSMAFAACGSSNTTNGNGVTSDGRCDSGLISANNTLANEYNARRTMADAVQLDKDCQDFSSKYPNSVCRALDDKTKKEISFDTKEVRKICKENHKYVQPTPPAETTPPGQNPSQVAITGGDCTSAFLLAYTNLGKDAEAVRAAGNNFGQVIVSAEKMSQDCKAFVAAYPATVCTAYDYSKPRTTTATVDSRAIQMDCKKINDYMDSLNTPPTAPKANEAITLELQSL